MQVKDISESNNNQKHLYITIYIYLYIYIYIYLYCMSVILGLRLLWRCVREVLELLLVDLSDDGLVRRGQNGVLLREVLVEIIHISFGFNAGLKGRFDLPLLQ